MVFFFYRKLKWICNERSELSVGRAARAVLHTEARHADQGVCVSVDWEELKKTVFVFTARTCLLSADLSRHGLGNTQEAEIKPGRAP